MDEEVFADYAFEYALQSYGKNPSLKHPGRQKPNNKKPIKNRRQAPDMH
jgi:hypothetical protein